MAKTIGQLTLKSEPDNDDEFILEQPTPNDSFKTTFAALRTPPGRIITVADDGADFTTIKEALDSITDNSDANRYTIQISPGIYSEDNPLQGKAFVSVEGVGSLGTTVVEAANASQDLFASVGNFILANLSLDGVSGANNYAINHSTPGGAGADDISFSNCSNGLLLNNVAAAYFISSLSLVAITGTIDTAITNQAGNLTIQDVQVAASSTIATILETTGANAITTIDIFNTFSPNVTTAILFDTSSQSVLRSISIVGATTGVIAQNGASGRVFSGGIFNCTTGISMPDVGSDSILGIGTIDINENTINVNVASDTANFFGQWIGDLVNTQIAQASDSFFLNVDLSEGEEGVSIIGELHVGRAENPTESSFGGGDSYARGMLVYSFNPTGSIFTDISVLAGSPSGSTFTFPNTAIGTALYFASSLGNGNVIQHPGIKANIQTAVTLGGGSFVYEYWNGSIWNEFTFMVTQAGDKYLPFAEQLFEQSGDFQIRYDLTIDDWVENDDPGIGTNFFWARIRIASTITTSPTIEQTKLHSNRAEFNEDGYLEFFGTSRPIVRFPWDAALSKPATSTPADQNLFLSDDLDVGRSDNKFKNTSTDRVAFLAPLPETIDTSSPISFSWMITSNNSGGNIEWNVSFSWQEPGDNVFLSSASAPSTAPNESVINLIEAAPLAADTSKWYSVELDISGAISRRDGDFPDTIWVSLERIGTSGSDTHSGDVSLVAISSDYVTWNIGGHI